MEQHKAIISELAAQYGKRVFHSAFRLLGDSHLAEDVTQDVFIKLFSKPLSALKAVKNWPAYLKTMAVSTAIDYLRRTTRLAEDGLDETLDKTEGSNVQPLQQVLQERDFVRFKSALVQLTEQDAHIYCLRNIEGYSYQEISQALDMSSNAVGVSLHRSQLKLTSTLGQSQFLGESHAI